MMSPLYLMEGNLNKTHFPSRRSLCTRNGASCFSGCVRFRLPSCGSCLCFFLYFSLDGDKGVGVCKFQTKMRVQMPRKEEGGRKTKQKNHGQDMPDRKKQVTLVPRIAHC